MEFNSNKKLTKLAESKGISNWDDLVQYVRKLPYRRNSARSDFGLVLTEEMGTCSSKHALLKSIADENDFGNIQLMLCVYEMSSENTPNIGNVLEEANLGVIPEVHCFLLDHGMPLDCTFESSNFDQIDQGIIQEMVIEPKEIIEFKPNLHIDVIKKWIKEKQIPYSYEAVWDFREKCIKNIEKWHASKK